MCLLVLSGILVAGLWPFHAPKNEVSWLSSENGLWFGDYGSILSSREFAESESRDSPCSLEIWLQPAATFDSNEIVAFSPPENPLQFALAQSGDDLFLIRNLLDTRRRLKATHIAIDHVFHKGIGLLITVTSGTGGTTVYLNGIPVKATSQFTFTGRDFTGQLVIGNSPVQNNSWGGKLWGVGIYGRELTSAQVSQHYVAWTTNRRPELVQDEQPRAVYLFREHRGTVVHNQVESGPDLYIPENYFVLHQPLLEPFWKEFIPNWTFCENVLLNIGAFVPLGLFLCAYLSIAELSRPRLIAIIIGGVISLTIEVLQSQLPTRDSGTMDIITNTLGTVFGVVAYGYGAGDILLGKNELHTTALDSSEMCSQMSSSGKASLTQRSA